MMRILWATFAAIVFGSAAFVEQPVSGQQPSVQQPGRQQLRTTPSYARQSGEPQPGQSQRAQQRVAAQPDERVARQTRAEAAPNQGAAANQAPFPPLSAAETDRLQQFLLDWQQQSQGTKTLECKFSRWHFDNLAAPPGIHAEKAEGVIKYAAPDKGLFRVDQLVFFNGREAGNPSYKEHPDRFGEHWVCNGKQLIEFDRSQKQCRIQDLPPQMQGTKIFNSPLPFVFNLDADEIQRRYWVRLQEAGKSGIVLVEAYPKTAQDRAQYKLVQVALDTQTFAPQALVMYPPNFHPKTAPNWDHYEFSDVKRNSIGARFQQFIGKFYPEKPPADWKILREKFNPDPAPADAVPPAGQPALQQAVAPGTGQQR